MNARRNPLRALLRCRILAAAALLALGLSGCVVIPMPPGLSDPSDYAQRRNLNAVSGAQFTPGRTTVADVLLALGEPDQVSVDERLYAYQSSKTVGVLVVLPLGGGPDIKRDCTWVFAFNSAGLLEKATLNAAGEFPAKRWPEVDATNVPPWLAGEHVAQVLGAKVRRLDASASAAAASERFRSGPAGHLFLTDSKLLFYSRSQFGNDAPELVLRFAQVTGVEIRRQPEGSLLLVQCQENQLRAFEIDEPAINAASAFIKSKLAPRR